MEITIRKLAIYKFHSMRVINISSTVNIAKIGIVLGAETRPLWDTPEMKSRCPMVVKYEVNQSNVFQ